jgi:hypothetical protein
MREIFGASCARAANGHEVADPAIALNRVVAWLSFEAVEMRLQQGFATDGMGLRRQVAWQQFQAANVRFGS